ALTTLTLNLLHFVNPLKALKESFRTTKEFVEFYKKGLHMHTKIPDLIQKTYVNHYIDFQGIINRIMYNRFRKKNIKFYDQNKVSTMMFNGENLEIEDITTEVKELENRINQTSLTQK
ncbi:MAG: hypothetical protein ABDH28_03520, partial [Brevinematia bacterium]